MESTNKIEISKNKIKNKTTLDKIVKVAFTFIAMICASVIIVIVAFIFIEGLKPFFTNYEINGINYRPSFFPFVFGLSWEASPYQYGIGFIIINTLYVTLCSLLIAVPISVLTALLIVRIAPKFLSKTINYVIELLASIPSIIYGIFGAGVITNIVKNLANLFNYQSAGGVSTLATIIVLAMMIIPTITLISITSIKTVKADYIKGSLALGASSTQTNFKVVLTSAKSGIFSGIILGVGRALGEATAVTMVAGNATSGPTFNLFDITRTLTSTMLANIKETSGLSYDIRFSVGIFLILIILVTNLILNFIRKRIGNYEK